MTVPSPAAYASSIEHLRREAALELAARTALVEEQRRLVNARRRAIARERRALDSERRAVLMGARERRVLALASRMLAQIRPDATDVIAQRRGALAATTATEAAA